MATRAEVIKLQNRCSRVERERNFLAMNFARFLVSTLGKEAAGEKIRKMTKEGSELAPAWEKVLEYIENPTFSLKEM